MNEKKICPILTESLGHPMYCVEHLCAWWRESKPQEAVSGCALLKIARCLGN